MGSDQQVIDAVLSELNPQQEKAAGHPEGPLLIIAGAGTGKTTTLAHRVAYLIAAGTDPGRILLLTFTRRAAGEMLRRVDTILKRLRELQMSKTGRDLQLTSRKLLGGTFHSVACRLLRRHGKLIGLDPEFTILDRGDSEDLLNVVRNELKIEKTESRFPLKGTCLDIYSRCVNTQGRLENILETAFPWCVDHTDALKQLFRNYVDRKERQAVLDYDDLLLFWRELVMDEAGGQAVRAKFDCVLVDEYQDTNVLQAETLRAMCPTGKGLTVVGDDAQSIYSFRAATVRNILDFTREYPQTTVVTLEENYRSTQPILDAANGVIALAKERHKKDLHSARGAGERPVIVNCYDEDEQTDFLIGRILEHRETAVELKQQAVLFRASHHSLALEMELTRRNIPFHKYGGLKFIETAHVKDLLAFLKLAENPRDVVAGLRVLTLLPGLGPKKARHLMDLLESQQADFNAWSDYKPPAATGEIWARFVTLMKGLGRRTAKGNAIAGEVHRVRKFYAPLLEQKLDHAQSRLRDLAQLEQVAARFADRTAFLTEITLDPPSSTQELPADPLLDEDYLILSTMHSAKGLEWDTVFVIHAADGNIPSDMATGSPEEIEEERRLFYVALTRARNRLYVCHPQRYFFHNRFRSDAHSFSQLTRFLPEKIQPLFDRESAGTELPEDSRELAAPHITSADVRTRMKRMWS